MSLEFDANQLEHYKNLVQLTVSITKVFGSGILKATPTAIGIVAELLDVINTYTKYLEDSKHEENKQHLNRLTKKMDVNKLINEVETSLLPFLIGKVQLEKLWQEYKNATYGRQITNFFKQTSSEATLSLYQAALVADDTTRTRMLIKFMWDPSQGDKGFAKHLRDSEFGQRLYAGYIKNNNEGSPASSNSNGLQQQLPTTNLGEPNNQDLASPARRVV